MLETEFEMDTETKEVTKEHKVILGNFKNPCIGKYVLE